MLIGIAIYLLILVVILIFLVASVSYFVRHFFFKKKDASGKRRPLGLRELLLGSLMLSSGIMGFTGALMFPVGFLGVDNIGKSSTALVTYVIASMLFLIAGTIIKNLTGKFLMTLGIFMLLFSVLPFITNAGKSTGLIAILIAFIVLVTLIVRSSRKEQHG